MIYIISYYQAGGNQRGSSFSKSMGWLSFEDKICFNTIREYAKETVMNSIEGGSLCISDSSIFYTIVRIENDKVTGKYVGDVKSTNVLKWKDKK